MDTAQNFQYQVGGTLSADAINYIKRRGDDELYDGLKAAKFCYVLSSPQMGKSSLKVQTMKRLEADGVKCAEIDLTRIGTDVTVDRWYRTIFNELAKQFNLSINRSTWWNERNSISPIQCLNELVEEVLLPEVTQPIVIFIDEIDTILSLPFSTDDFFFWIRSCYNQRSNKPIFQRLTFCLLGVATPSDFIRDPNHTPFNTGKYISLSGFELHEVEPLARGLEAKLTNSQQVLGEILKWTNGQPLLTQKLCKMIVDMDFSVDEYEEGYEIILLNNLVRSRIIRNWESQDNPEHLKIIRNHLLMNKGSARDLLKLYKQILQRGSIVANHSTNQLKLCLSGLVVETNGNLKVYNPIYERVFNYSWVRKQLDELPPHQALFEAWVNSGCEKNSLLLSGEVLEDALEWAKGKNLDKQQSRFLEASQKKEDQRKQVESISETINIIKQHFSETTANNIYDEVMAWTSNHPSLTQEVNQLIVDYKSLVSDSNPRESIDNLIRTYLLSNWENKSAATHLQEMRNRLLHGDKESTINRLQYYKEVLIGKVIPDGSSEQKELLDAGLIANNNNQLEVTNRIYGEIFNRQWVEKELDKIIQNQNLPSSSIKLVSILALAVFLIWTFWHLFFSDKEKNQSSLTSSLSSTPEVCLKRDSTKTLENEIAEINTLANQQNLSPKCKTQLHELELINVAIKEGKNNRVVPSSIDGLCEIADGSVNLGLATTLIKGWYDDQYWGERVKKYIAEKPNCPAIRELTVQQLTDDKK